MPTRPYSVVLDATDPRALARFRADALGWAVVTDRADEAEVRCEGAPEWGDGGPPRLLFDAVGEPKQGKNRLHVDLVALPGDDHDTEVRRLEQAGARRVDIGQGDVPWTVLADPGGNEHCLLDLG